MRFFIIFATVLLAVSALPAQEQWTSFKAKHGKSYENINEEKLRFQIFQDNVKKINAHNALFETGLKTYTMGINQFTDFTPKEFRAMLKLQNGPISRERLTRHIQNGTAPDSIDWREKLAVSRVQDQGKCGCCWAFSTVGAIEGQNAIKNNNRKTLSVQHLVDCLNIKITDNLTITGCQGGTFEAGYKYVIEHGLNTDYDYPFEGTDNNCRAQNYSAVKVLEGVAVDPTESALKEAVGTVGPITVAINADPLQFYYGGILDDDSCDNGEDDVYHAVLAIGYGTENGKKFWLLKNEWGINWGEKGFYRMARDANNQCGVAIWTTYPILA